MRKTKTLRLRREAAATPAGGVVEEKPERQITERDAATRARIRRAAAFPGTAAWPTRLVREVKRTADFREKLPKKRRGKKRGRR